MLNALFRVDGVRSKAPHPFEHLFTEAGDIWVYELLMYPDPLRLNEWCLEISEQLNFLADVLSNTSNTEEKRSIHICTKKEQFPEFPVNHLVEFPLLLIKLAALCEAKIEYMIDEN